MTGCFAAKWGLSGKFHLLAVNIKKKLDKEVNISQGKGRAPGEGGEKAGKQSPGGARACSRRATEIVGADFGWPTRFYFGAG